MGLTRLLDLEVQAEDDDESPESRDQLLTDEDLPTHEGRRQLFNEQQFPSV